MTLRLARRVTHELLAGVAGEHHAVVAATAPGVVAGTELITPPGLGDSMGRWTLLRNDGDRVDAGEPIIAVDGNATELALAEDHVLGVLGMAGGIARRACEIKAASPSSLTVVCGGWKKLPAAVKPVLRAGLEVAGVGHRMLPGEFVYVGKNPVELLGGVEAAVIEAMSLDHGPVVIQVTSVADAVAASYAGAAIVMVDTGSLADLGATHDALVALELRDRVQVAFGGGVTATDLAAVAESGADLVDIGRAIVDAPIWDLRMTVTAAV